MCPVCMTTTLTLIAGSVTATGGLTALAARIFRNQTGAEKLDSRNLILSSNPKEKEDESAIQS